MIGANQGRFVQIPPITLHRRRPLRPEAKVSCPLPGAGVCPTWEPSSVGARWRPLLTTGVVTHLVTRFRGGFCLTI